MWLAAFAGIWTSWLRARAMDGISSKDPRPDHARCWIRCRGFRAEPWSFGRTLTASSRQVLRAGLPGPHGRCGTSLGDGLSQISGVSIPQAPHHHQWQGCLALGSVHGEPPGDMVVSGSGTVARHQGSVSCITPQGQTQPTTTRSRRGAARMDGAAGFYVYRNERLLVAGNWLGLGRGRSWTKEEAHRLARVRLDIPNSADADWKIDIRKSTARPPVSVRQDLTHLMEDTCRRARGVFAHRGRIMGHARSRSPVAQAWRADRCNDGMRYRVDLSHPAVKAVLEHAGALAPQIKAMIRVLEETVPVQRIWLDTAEGRETPRTGFAGSAPAEIQTIAEVLFNDLLNRQGLSPERAREQLLHTEPFHDYPDLIAELSSRPSAGCRGPEIHQMANEEPIIKLLQALLQAELGKRDITPTLIGEKLDWLIKAGRSWASSPAGSTDRRSSTR